MISEEKKIDLIYNDLFIFASNQQIKKTKILKIDQDNIFFIILKEDSNKSTSVDNQLIIYKINKNIKKGSIIDFDNHPKYQSLSSIKKFDEVYYFKNYFLFIDLHQKNIFISKLNITEGNYYLVDSLDNK